MKSIRKYLQHKYALSEKGAKDMIKAACCCLFFNLTLMPPIALLYFLVGDLLTDGRISTDRMWFYIIGMVVCLLLIFISTNMQYRATFYATYIESGVRRISLAERLRKIPLSFFGKKDLADLTSTIMADCSTIEQTSSHYLPQLYGAIASTTIIAIGLLFTNWRMAIAATWVLPVAFLIVGFSSKVQGYLGRKQMKAKMDCADGIQECLETFRDLKSNNAENRYLSGLFNKVKLVEKRALFSELGTASFVVSSQLILKLGIVSVAFAGGVMLMSDSLDVLTFFMFLLVVAMLYDPLIMALQNLAAVISLNVPSERMNVILEHPIQTGSDKLTNNGFDIVFDHVGFAYDTSEMVLNDVSFTARQGEVTALIGPSGGGKTTASRLAARFWDITKGKITVGGMDISTVNPETLMTLYSIVFQNVTLFNNTVMENIRLGRRTATDAEVIEAGKLANCDEFVDKLPQKWNTPIGENGSELSGGERQRISIARAFLKDAPIIFLDEATASLDVENETMIQESLSNLIKDKTVMIIAHRMRTIAEADKIVVLKDGNIVQQGSPEELSKVDGVYKTMIGLQNLTVAWKL